VGKLAPDFGSPGDWDFGLFTHWFVNVVASLSSDGKSLTMAVINANKSPQELDLTFRGITLAGKGRMWRMTAPVSMPPLAWVEMMSGAWKRIDADAPNSDDRADQY
jgi:hypothetical protein